MWVWVVVCVDGVVCIFEMKRSGSFCLEAVLFGIISCYGCWLIEFRNAGARSGVCTVTVVVVDYIDIFQVLYVDVICCIGYSRFSSSLSSIPGIG